MPRELNVVDPLVVSDCQRPLWERSAGSLSDREFFKGWDTDLLLSSLVSSHDLGDTAEHRTFFFQGFPNQSDSCRQHPVNSTSGRAYLRAPSYLDAK